MNNHKIRPLFAACFFLLGFSQSPGYCENHFLSSVKESAEKIKDRLSLLRITAEDCSLIPRWELPLTIGKVEDLLARPLDAPNQLSAWSASALKSSSTYDLLRLSREIFSADREAPSPLKDGTPSSLPREASLGTAALSASPTPPEIKNAEAEEIKFPPDYDLLPPSLRSPIFKIVTSMKSALPLLKESYRALTEKERAELLTLYDFPLESGSTESIRSPAFKRKCYAAMKKFKQDSLLNAAEMVLKTIHEEMDRLREGSVALAVSSSSVSDGVQTASFKPVRLKTEVGEVLVSGNGEDHYSAASLKDVALLIDLGGKNSYAAPVAGAREGEIKVVVDFGSEVTVVSTMDVVSAGAGVFGMGFLFLPNASGKKNFITDSYSQGMGLCGVGGLFVNGPGDFRGERYLQGVGIFGVGIFSNEGGNASDYQANLYAQGVGFTRGVGIFRHRGSRARLQAGLVDPDPRESLGTTSLCQGVGYGPRGYAGGGVGLCVLSGNQLNLESSYFAQGAGYWHAAGSFLIEGSSNSLRARRYDLGSGIHSAVGAFFLNGNNNHLINWGVGPAYGWDGGLGLTFFFGNENRVQAEWGVGSATYNRSRSFSFFSGNNNKFDLPGLGGGQYVRDLSDYSLSIMEGKDNFLKLSRLKSRREVNEPIFVSPWGAIFFRNVALMPEVGLPKAEWKKLRREEVIRKEKINLGEEIQQAESSLPAQKIERLLQVASAFSVDKIHPRNALSRLLALGDGEIPFIVRSLDPADIEGLVQIRAVLGIFGDRASQTILDELKSEVGERRALLFSMLAFAKVEKAAPIFLQGLEDDDWRIQAASARNLGWMLNRDPGGVPGRLHILRTLERWFNSFFPSAQLTQELLRQLSTRPFAESVSILSLARQWSSEERRLILDAAPEDINGNFESEKVKKVMVLLRANRKESLKNIREEIRKSDLLIETARGKLLSVLKKLEGNSRHPSLFSHPSGTEPSGRMRGMVQSLKGRKTERKELAHALIIALGNIGSGQDAEKISRYLEDNSALVRDGASASLGRIGRGSLPFLEKAMQSPDPDKRVQAILSAVTASDPSLLALLEMGLNDPDPAVRKVSFSAIEQVPSPLTKAKEKLKKKILKLRASVPDSASETEQLFLYGH